METEAPVFHDHLIWTKSKNETELLQMETVKLKVNAPPFSGQYPINSEVKKGVLAIVSELEVNGILKKSVSAIYLDTPATRAT